MWISRKEYKRLIDENHSLEESVEYKRIIYQDLAERNTTLLNENMRLSKEIEQLKVKYADEVNKNFELASHLSENK